MSCEEPLFFTTTDGVRLHYRVQGNGEPVLLVHGFPDSMAVWRKQVPALLAAGYRVITLDLRGFGASEAPVGRARYAVGRLVADLGELLDHLRLPRVRLVAHDWGAAIGWVFCIRHPERVERYFAVSVGHPAAYARGGLLQKLRGWYILAFQLPGVSEALLKAFDCRLLRLLLGCAEEEAAWSRDFARPGRMTAALNYYRQNLVLAFRSEWPVAGVNAMGAWSSRDRFLVEAQVRRSVHHVAGHWQYESLPGGHWVQVECPGVFNNVLLAYLAQRL